MYDLLQTKELARRAVQERGEDFVYPDEGEEATAWRDGLGQCRYRNEETEEPACIVGLIFSYIDLLDLLSEGWGIWAQGDAVADHFTDEALTFLSRLQGQQDRGDTWGVAYATASDIVATRYGVGNAS